MSWGQITDTRIYAEPPLPVLPSGGGTFTDPVFGSTLMRATDGVDGDCKHAYSIWPTFNADSTAFHVDCNGQPTLFRFDPTAFKILSKEPLFTRGAPSGGWLSWEDLEWSRTNPAVVYGREGARIWAYDVNAKTYTLVKDFGTQYPAGTTIQRMTMSGDDNAFAFTRVWNGKQVGFGLYHRASDRMAAQEPVEQWYKMQVDKTGQHALAILQTRGAGVPQAQMYGADGSMENLIDNAPDYAPGHADMGTNLCVGIEDWGNRVLKRASSSPHQWTVLFNWGNEWGMDTHYSLKARDESWVLVSSHETAPAHTTGYFHNELFLLATDGSGRVKRLAHHRSIYRDYWDLARANISFDGRFAVFTSNWGTAKRDVFIVRIPGAPAAAPLTVTPATATVAAGQSVALTASAPATWSIAPALGAIDANGRYTAPGSVTAQTTVIATATGASGTASATLTVLPALAVTPATATVTAGQSVTFTANGPATWSISPAIGSISAAGVYTAPASVAAATTVVVAATGASGTATATVTVQPALAVTPATATVIAGQSVAFTANGPATWSISPVIGSISAAGVYTAPASVAAATTVVVTATGASSTARATVTVQPAASTFGVTAPRTYVNLDTSLAFTALLNGAPTGNVTWRVTQGGGSITSAGVYWPPAVSAPQTVVVTAANNGNPAQTASMTITAYPRIFINITRSASSVRPGGTVSFSVVVTNTPDPRYTYSLSPNFGTIDPVRNVYTAPKSVAAKTSVQVKVTSVSDPSKSDWVYITVMK